MVNEGAPQSDEDTRRVVTSSDRHGTPTSQGSDNSLSHSPAEWKEIQPRLTHLYITLDLTLRECMAKLEEELAFYASEQMYKKRIKAWGLTKSVKSRQKDRVISELISGPASSEAAPSPAIRHDKLIRHAHTRVKAGLLDPAHLRRLKARRTAQQPALGARHHNHRSPSTFAAHADAASAEIAPPLPASQHRPTPSLAGPLASFDLFLRAFRTVIHKERSEWLTYTPPSPATTVRAFTRGMSAWSREDFRTARLSFSAAAQTFVADLQHPAGPLMSRMTYFIGAPVWDQITCPVALGFRDFMVRAARENLGPGHPLTLTMEGLRIKQDLHAQLAVWSVAMDLYRDTDGMHLYGMARHRWIWCRENGLVELAWWYREHAEAEIEKVGRLTEEMVRQADEDLAVAPRRARACECA